MKLFLLPFAIFSFSICISQTDQKIYDIINSVSSERIEADETTLANFGTRNTFSDTVSKTRGSGAVRRRIKSECEKVSNDSNTCLKVFDQRDVVKAEGNDRIPIDTQTDNVAAVHKDTNYPN